MSPAIQPHMVPNLATTALQEQIDTALGKEVARRLVHLGQPPILTPNVMYQYGHRPNYIVTPHVSIAASSPWNPLPRSSTILVSNEDPTPAEDSGDKDAEGEVVGKPPKPYQMATVRDFLLHPNQFEGDFRLRIETPPPHRDVSNAGDLAERRRIAKQRNSRIKRAHASEVA